jgi:hypothetical protein
MSYATFADYDRDKNADPQEDQEQYPFFNGGNLPHVFGPVNYGEEF